MNVYTHNYIHVLIDQIITIFGYKTTIQMTTITGLKK